MPGKKNTKQNMTSDPESESDSSSSSPKKDSKTHPKKKKNSTSYRSYISHMARQYQKNGTCNFTAEVDDDFKIKKTKQALYSADEMLQDFMSRVCEEAVNLVAKNKTKTIDEQALKAAVKLVFSQGQRNVKDADITSMNKSVSEIENWILDRLELEPK